MSLSPQQMQKLQDALTPELLEALRLQLVAEVVEETARLSRIEKLYERVEEAVNLIEGIDHAIGRLQDAIGTGRSTGTVTAWRA
jgi:hypothetical protein